MTRTIDDLPVVSFTGDDIMSGRFPTLLAARALEHGPIYKWVITQGGDAGEFVFMVGPEANRFVLHTGREHFSHDDGWTPIIGDTLGKGLLNMDPPEHTAHRRMWNPAFAGAAIEAYLPVIERTIAARSRDWIEQDTIDAYHEAREITFDAAAAALAGLEPGPRVDRLRELFYVLLHGFDPVEVSWEDYVTRAYGAQRQLAALLLELIAERRALGDDERPHDVVGRIVRARDESGLALTDEQLLAHVNILLVAGHETTTTLGAWVLYLLATQPEHRRRIEAELRELLGDRPGPLTVEAIRSMHLLDNFIKEAGRLYPPVLDVPRGVLSDFEFAGYRIPAGSQVRLSLAGAHMLPHVFAEPERFDPDRFAPPREEDRRTPYGLVTFGGGPRICIGINFAQIETKALAAYALRNFQLEAVPGQQLRHAGHWTAVLEHGIRLRVRPREA